MTLANHIVIMSKFPRLGEVKTRLIPALGAERAMDLHTRMSQHRVASVKEFASSRNDVSYGIHIANGSLAEASEWLGEHQYFLQQGDDLGQRMEHAVELSFQAGAKRVMVVGTDCPSLSEKEFTEVLLELERYDVVYVPAEDGGYVLVGLSGDHLEVFKDVEWGTENVMKQSLERARAAHINSKLLDELADVDRIEDVPAAELILASEE